MRERERDDIKRGCQVLKVNEGKGEIGKKRRERERGRRNS